MQRKVPQYPRAEAVFEGEAETLIKALQRLPKGLDLKRSVIMEIKVKHKTLGGNDFYSLPSIIDGNCQAALDVVHSLCNQTLITQAERDLYIMQIQRIASATS